MTKQTYQPKKRHRAKEHGFRARMKTQGGRKVHGADDPFGPRLQMRDAYAEEAEVEELHKVGF